jgi:hypothetical protein
VVSALIFHCHRTWCLFAADFKARKRWQMRFAIRKPSPTHSSVICIRGLWYCYEFRWNHFPVPALFFNPNPYQSPLPTFPSKRLIPASGSSKHSPPNIFRVTVDHDGHHIEPITYSCCNETYSLSIPILILLLLVLLWIILAFCHFRPS